MSSLRLALKQSLQETGHLAPKEKKKKGSSAPSSRRRRRRTKAGRPPRKRGRPPKANSHDDDNASKDNGSDHDDEELGNSSSENELSYESGDSNDEEEEDDDEEEDDEDDGDDEEDDDEHEDDEDDGEEEEDGEVGEKVPTGRRSPRRMDDAAKATARPKAAAGEDEESSIVGEDGNDGDREQEEGADHGRKHMMRQKLKRPRVKSAEPSGSDEERRRQRKLLKKQMKHSAANKIQEQWKKKKAKDVSTTGTKPDTGSVVASSADTGAHSESAENSRADTAATSSNDGSAAATGGTKKKNRQKKRSSEVRTVPAPIPEVLEWARNLSEKRSRKYIASGMRVKVRFAKKVKREGKVVKRKMWYGGRVSAVSKEGTKIRIKYDDGTSEIAKYPDKDVVIDADGNGEHLVPADKFIPPPTHEQEAETEESASQSESMPESQKDEPKHEAETEEPASQRKLQSGDGPSPSQHQKQVSPPLSESADVDERGDPDSGHDTRKSTDNAKDDKTGSQQQQHQQHMEESTPSRASSSPSGSGRAPQPIGSPEEGELSPGISYPLDETTMDIKPPASAAPSENVDGVGQNATDKEPEKAPASSGKDAGGSSGQPSPATPKSTSRPSLTIRISNPKLRPDDKGTSPKRAAALWSARTSETNGKDDNDDDGSSEGEIVGTNSRREQQSSQSHNEEDQFQSSSATMSRKRSASDDPVETSHPRKRITLKKDRERVVSDQPQRSAEEPTTVGIAAVEGRKAAELEVLEALSSFATSERVDNDPKPDSKRTISISTKQATNEYLDEIPLAPPAVKVKRKKDRGNSPVPRNRRSASPTPRSRSPARADSPTPMSNDAKESSPVGGVVKPVSKHVSKKQSPNASNETGSGAASPVPTQKRTVVGSKNSAFAKKQAGKDAKESSEQKDSESRNDESGTGDGPVNSKSGPKDQSKGSSESLTRAGRRAAAQQAKEKMNPKQETPAAESVKRKKKRRRKEEKESDAEESDYSDDDPKWVQCENCDKWRVIPSHVKISSLPKHWYCHLNVYDPKRNTCSAPEQTPKQVAKERRRAKKRVRQQKLEQQQQQLEQQQQHQKHLQQQVELEAKKKAEEEKQKKEKESSTPAHSPKATKGSSSSRKTLPASVESKKSPSPQPAEEQSDSGSDNRPAKAEKKGKKSRTQDNADTPASNVESSSEPVKVKVGRKRGRPARTPASEAARAQAAQDKKEDSDNVEWVQCELCEKWRKLPPHIEASELPDVWYCSMNTWNPEAASCDTPEDQADAMHQEVGTFAGQMPPGNAGKFSYRSMIFGTGRKHNRPMSERSRAAESLFMKPADDADNPYPTVMYSKSSMFLPRTSNFNKSANSDDKTPSIFDALSNSELWTELRSEPMNVLSSTPTTTTSSGATIGQAYPKFVSYENLPDEIKHMVREVVLTTLGKNALTADDVIQEVERYPWETISPDFAEIRPYFANADIMVNSLLSLVRDGVVEMTCLRNPNIPMTQWIPKYRRVRTRRALQVEEAMKASRCMKIAKPWKQREENNNNSNDWVTGGAAFS